MLSLDTETTGIDLYHSAQPFFVTICDSRSETNPRLAYSYWEWDVAPETRKVSIPPKDLREIWGSIEGKDLVLQNAKFDATALCDRLCVTEDPVAFPWNRVYDTLLAGHLLASNHPHDLTSMALEYLGKDIQPYEDRLEAAVKESRRICRGGFPSWRIANRGLPEMPSAREKTWKFDSWLPRTLRRLENEGPEEWDTVLRDYAVMDGMVTLALWKVQKELLQERGLWEIYQERRKLLPIAYEMERRGVTLSGGRLDELITEYTAESQRLGNVCQNVAGSYGFAIDMPNGGVNKSLKRFVFGKNYLNLPHVKTSPETGEPGLDKGVLEEYLSILPRNSKALAFIRALRDKRKRDTAVNYLEGYKRYWLPLSDPHRVTERGDALRNQGEGGGVTDPPVASENRSDEESVTDPLCVFVLHPSLNPTGTDTLRWSSSNPNEQNISKQEGFNLRYAFGPTPGREWWSMDAENIELRIPAYEAGEREMIDLFEQPDKPPYYGSYHLLVAHALHPQKFERCLRDGVSFKDRYRSTLYQWVKNGNFAVQYGAVEESGTADRAYHVPGAQRLIQSRFRKIKELGDRQVAFANKWGYVETIPDKTVNPLRGYPLLVQRSNWGGVKPTIPLNYHVQGTACWWMMKAMIRCQGYLDELNRMLVCNRNRTLTCNRNRWFFMILQVHDELVFDFPQEVKKGYNERIANKLRQLMEDGGRDIGIPTPVKMERITDHW